MRILFLGDIVGSPGVGIVRRGLEILCQAENVDFVIVNAENAAGGSGLTEGLYRKLRNAGVDLFTLGDHIYKRKEIIGTLEAEERICKPANYPPEAPGREYAIAEAKDGTRIAVLSVLGRTFMRSVDCPFQAADRVLDQLRDITPCVFVDIHAEATADKYLMGHHLDGRVTAVLGTHTHVPTADEQLLPKGTAFQCDVGMTGPYESVLGRRIDRVLSATVTFVPTPFDVASGDPRMAGAIVELDPTTGKAANIQRIMVGENELKCLKDRGTAPDSSDAAM